MENPNPHPSESKPSPWGNYLKEFLLLFLAISLGFGVENLRQEREDRQAEREFMVSLLDELSEDSAKLVEGIRINKIKMSGFDSLLLALQNPPPYPDSTLHLIYYLQRRYTGSNQSVNLSERTLKQLLATGGYRLIQNRQIATEIAHYHEMIERLNHQAHVMIFEYQIKSREMGSRLIDAASVFGLTRETSGFLLDPSRKLKPLSGGKVEINEYANWLTASNGSFFYYGKQMENKLAKIPNLMALIEKEYQLPHPKSSPISTLFRI